MPKYDSIDTIKAKVFFKILETKNYQLLKPKPKEKGLEQIFIGIYDEFFIRSDNDEAKQYLELTKQIAFLEAKIAYLKQALHFYYYNKTTNEMRLEFVEALSTGYDIVIDINAPFRDEVLRVLTVEVGIIENDLSMAKSSYEQMTKKSQQKAISYESRVVGIENVLKRSVDDDITLAKYVEYEKSAKQIVSSQMEEHQRNKNKKVA